MPIPFRKIDLSNRSDHYHLRGDDECFYLHDYTPRQGARHSQGNQFIYNLKKSVLRRDEYDYRYKMGAIRQSITLLRSAFDLSAGIFNTATFCAIPPSKLPGHPEYDDRMEKIVAGACHNTAADVRALVVQNEGYEPTHLQSDGDRKRPSDFEAIYSLDSAAPKSVVILVDDVLTTGAHFVAAKNIILAQYPNTRVIGFFLARRVLPNPFVDTIQL